MGSEWKQLTIGDVCYVTDGAHTKVERVDHGVMYLTSKNIGAGELKLDSFDFIQQSDFERLFADTKKSQRKLKTGDVLMGIIGTFGNCYIYKETDKFGISSSVAILRSNPEVILPEYLYFVISSNSFFQIVEKYKGGSVQGYTNIATIKALPISVPSLETQQKIVKQLIPLNLKITLNRQINQTLEQMAQTLFKSWFVDFDPVIDNALDAGNEIPEPLQTRAELRQKVRASQDFQPLPADVRALFPAELEESELGWVPKGWVCSPLSSLFGIKHGFAFKGEYFCDEITSNILLTPGNVKIGGGFKSDKFKYYLGPIPNEYVFNADDLYVNMTDLSKISDTLGYPARVPENSEIQFLHNQRLGRVVFTHHPAAQKEFVYQVLCSDQYRNTILGSATGTTVKHTSPSKILDHVICYSASGNPEKAFESVSSFMSKKISINNQNSEHLTKLRDTLLPKLISGELRLDDLPDEVVTAVNE